MTISQTLLSIAIVVCAQMKILKDDKPLAIYSKKRKSIFMLNNKTAKKNKNQQNVNMKILCGRKSYSKTFTLNTLIITTNNCESEIC